MGKNEKIAISGLKSKRLQRALDSKHTIEKFRAIYEGLAMIEKSKLHYSNKGQLAGFFNEALEKMPSFHKTAQELLRSPGRTGISTLEHFFLLDHKDAAKCNEALNSLIKELQSNTTTKKNS